MTSFDSKSLISLSILRGSFASACSFPRERAPLRFLFFGETVSSSAVGYKSNNDGSFFGRYLSKMEIAVSCCFLRYLAYTIPSRIYRAVGWIHLSINILSIIAIRRLLLANHYIWSDSRRLRTFRPNLIAIDSLKPLWVSVVWSCVKLTSLLLDCPRGLAKFGSTNIYSFYWGLWFGSSWSKGYRFRLIMKYLMLSGYLAAPRFSD